MEVQLTRRVAPARIAVEAAKAAVIRSYARSRAESRDSNAARRLYFDSVAHNIENVLADPDRGTAIFVSG